MKISDGQLVALQRSQAMLPPGAPSALGREEALAVLEELLVARALLARLGTDLRAVARHARAEPPGG